MQEATNIPAMRPSANVADFKIRSSLIVSSTQADPFGVVPVYKSRPLAENTDFAILLSRNG